MKFTSKFFSLPIILLVFASCQDKIKETYTVNSPVYMSYDALRSSFKVADGEKIIQPGKIYFKGNYIFVNEYQKGIHVIDNSNPSSPQVIKFIEIPGNVDMAIRGDMLYADSYVDLLTINIYDINNIQEVDRDTNVFPYIIPEVEEGSIIESIEPAKGVIVRYNVSEKTENIESHNSYFQRFRMWEEDMAYTNSGGPVKVNTTTGGQNLTGVGGSMARFTICDKSLYTVDNYNLKLFDLSVGHNPAFVKDIFVGWGIETIFPYNNKLFIGSTSGMFIYGIENPSEPYQIGQFRHASSCDPVVIEGNYAYVTLRGGNLCGAIESQLDVIDIQNLYEPRLVSMYPMEEPYGLGIDDSVLFVCDGNAGLKIYNASDPLKISDNLLAHYAGINAFDVIPLGNVLVLIGSGGLYQYDYSNLDSIRQLSHIPIYGD